MSTGGPLWEIEMHLHRMARMLLAMILLAVTAAGAQAPRRDESLENQLRQLKELHEKELIPEDVYQRQVQELLDRHSATSPAAHSDDLPDLSGTWTVRVEGLSIWAPRYALDKAIGVVTWKLSITPGDLSVQVAIPDPESDPPPNAEPAASAFEDVELRDVILRHDFVAFEVQGSGSAYEAYRLERFSADRIDGSYTVYDRYGGGPGSGPEYHGHLILTKVP